MTLQAARQPIILDRIINLTREVTETVTGDVTLGYDNLVRDTPDIDGTWALRRGSRYFGTAASLAMASLADALILQENDTNGDTIPTATAPFDLAVIFDDGARSIRWTATATRTAATFTFDGRLTTVTTFTLSTPRVTGAGDLDNTTSIVFYGLTSQEVTNDVQVETWAARVDPAPADDRVICDGRVFLLVKPRLYRAMAGGQPGPGRWDTNLHHRRGRRPAPRGGRPRARRAEALSRAGN